MGMKILEPYIHRLFHKSVLVTYSAMVTPLYRDAICRSIPCTNREALGHFKTCLGKESLVEQLITEEQRQDANGSFMEACNKICVWQQRRRLRMDWTRGSTLAQSAAESLSQPHTPWPLL